MNKFRGLLAKHGDDVMLVTGFLLFVAGILDRRNIILIAGGAVVIMLVIFTEPKAKEDRDAKP